MMNMTPSGMFDLGYYVYIATDREFRSKHLNACLEEYHKVLVGYLDFEFPLKELLDEFNRIRPMYIVGIMVNSDKCIF